MKSFAEMLRMDPMLNVALRKSEGSVVQPHMLQDTLIPSVGNLLAYRQHLAQNSNKGVHIKVNHLQNVNGDAGSKQFFTALQNVADKNGGMAFREGGNNGALWFPTKSDAHMFSRGFRDKLQELPGVNAAIGVGYTPEHASLSLQEAKNQNLGGAAIHSKLHEPAPEGWQESETGAVDGDVTPQLPNLTPQGLEFHNPLAPTASHRTSPLHIPLSPESMQRIEGKAQSRIQSGQWTPERADTSIQRLTHASGPKVRSIHLKQTLAAKQGNPIESAPTSTSSEGTRNERMPKITPAPVEKTEPDSE